MLPVRLRPPPGRALSPVRHLTTGVRAVSAATTLALAATLALTPAPAGAAARGAIEGRVVNRTIGEPQPGATVVLAGGRGGGRPPLERRATTDPSGRFVFRGLPTGADRAYTLDARYDGGLFAGRALSLPANTERPPVIEASMSVWDTTSDPTSVVIERDSLFVLQGEAGAGAVESVRIANTTRRAYIGRGATGDGAARAPTFALSLPADANLQGLRILDGSIDVPEIVSTSVGGFGLTVAIPPGTTALTFTYPLASSGGRIDLTRRALYPVLDLAVLASPPLDIEGGALRRAGEVTLEGRTYRRWSAPTTVAAGDTVEAVAVAEAGSGPALWGGAVVAAALVVAAGVAVRRRARSRRPGPGDEEVPRERLLEAIAELDLLLRAGDIAEAEWSARRGALKSRLERARTGAPERAS